MIIRKIRDIEALGAISLIALRKGRGNPPAFFVANKLVLQNQDL